MIEGPAKNPCGSCPYRVDTPAGVWAAEEYEKLPAYDGDTGYQPPALFLCHQQDGRVCAGWCGTHDMTQNLGLRMAASLQTIEPETFHEIIDYVSPVPLHSSGAEAAAFGAAGIENPSAKAHRIIQRLTSKRRHHGDNV